MASSKANFTFTFTLSTKSLRRRWMLQAGIKFLYIGHSILIHKRLVPIFHAQNEIRYFEYKKVKKGKFRPRTGHEGLEWE